MINGMRHVLLPDPALGTDFTYTQPPGVVSRLCWLNWRLVGDATVINRTAFVKLLDAGGRIVSVEKWNYLCSANLSLHYYSDDSYTMVESNFAYAGNNAAKHECAMRYLMPGWQMVSAVLNLQAGDGVMEIEMVLDDLNLVAS
jgi:hypothetical protein